MAKIDRLGWTAGIAFNCYGAEIGVRVSDPCALDEIVPRLPPGWRPADTPLVDDLFSFLVAPPSNVRGVKRFHLLYHGTAKISRTLDFQEAVSTLEHHLLFNVSVRSSQGLFVSGGVVEYGGRAIVLLGDSQVGTSTLVAELVKAGATYYSDEYAVFDEDGRVLPFAKPLTLPAGPEERKQHIDAVSLGGCVGERAVPVGLIVSTQYVPGARWRPIPLTAGECVITLLKYAVMTVTGPRDAIPLFRKAALGARGLEGPRGEAAETASALIKEVMTEIGDH